MATSRQKKSTTRRITGLTALLLAAPILAACGANAAPTNQSGLAEQSSEASAVTGGELIWAIESEPTTLNPQINGGAAAKHILHGLFDTYLFRTAEGDYEPWLAQEYVVSEDGKTITLTLRDDVTFSNGEPLNAEAVVANFDQLTSDDYANSGKGALSSLEGYKAIDDGTVEFTLSQPDALFLDYLTIPSSAPIAPESLANSAELEAGGTTVYGTGPFVLKAWNQGQDIVLTKRDDYAWAPAAIATADGTANLDTVTYRILSENSTRTGALSSGQVDIITGIPALDAPLFDGQDGYVYEENLAAGSPYSLYLNVSHTPFDDPKVREAFITGIDLDALLESTYRGQVQRAWGSVSPTSPFYDASLENSIEYDPDKANALLDEAGWTERDSEGYRVKDGERLKIRIVTAAPYVRDNRDVLNQAIGASAKTNLGLEYSYEPVDFGTEEEANKANAYEAFDNSYNATDVAGSYDVLYYSDPARGFIARGKFNDPQLDKLIDEGRYSLDTDARKETYLALQKYVADNAYQLPLYTSQETLAYHDDITGITYDPASGFAWGAYTVARTN